MRSVTCTMYVLVATTIADKCSHLFDQVSWGTKGSDKADALPSVSSSKGKGDAPVVEDVTKPQEDVDAAFKETVTRAVTKVESKEEIEKPTMDDQNKTFRTRLVAMWMLTNAGLAVAIENINGLPSDNEDENEERLRNKQSFYFSVILYSTFALAMVRFIGVRPLFSLSWWLILLTMGYQCLFYWFRRNMFRFCRRS